MSDAQASELLRVFMEDPSKLPDALHAAMKPGRLRQFLEFWKAGLLTGMGTHVANVTGNIAEQGAHIGETLTEAAIDKMLSGDRTHHGSAASAELKGAWSQVPKANSNLWSELGDAIKLAPEEIDVTSGSKFEHQVGAIGGKFGRAVRIPFRLLTAADDWFKAVGAGAELGKLSHEQAIRELGEGADKTAIERKAASIRADPPKEMLRKVEASILDRTFQETPGKLATGIINLRSSVPLLNVPAPFVKTPANIFNRFVQRSPLGFAKADVRTAIREYREASRAFKAGEIKKDAMTAAKGKLVTALARPVMGSAMIGSFAAIAAAGGLTGGGPSDPKKRALKLATGWKPYSFIVNLGGRKVYVPFNRFEPLSTPLGIVADAFEIGQEKDPGDMFNKAFGSVVNNVLNKSMLQGFVDFGQFVGNSRQVASQYIPSLVGSLVPNIVAKAAVAIDPTVRDVSPQSSGFQGIPEKLGKTIQSRIPFLSKKLPAKMEATGEEAQRSGDAFSRFALPIQPSFEKKGAELEQLLIDLDISPHLADRDFTVPGSRGKHLRLNDEELALMRSENKEASDFIRETYMQNKAFLRADPEFQKERIEKIYEAAQKAARKRLYALPSFREKMLEKRLEP